MSAVEEALRLSDRILESKAQTKAREGAYPTRAYLGQEEIFLLSLLLQLGDVDAHHGGEGGRTTLHGLDVFPVAARNHFFVA